VPSGYRNPHSKFLVMQGFFMQSMRILRRPQSCVLCVNITQEVEPGLICKEGDMKNINSFRLNKICEPFTVTDSFFHDPPVSILAPLLLCMGRVSIFLGPLYALLQARYLPLAPTCAIILMDSAA